MELRTREKVGELPCAMLLLKIQLLEDPLPAQLFQIFSAEQQKVYYLTLKIQNRKKADHVFLWIHL